MKLLHLLVINAVASFAVALAVGMAYDLPRQLPAHLVFALGILPLIFGAMGHFVPVLSRSGAPAVLIARLPLAGMAAGVVICLSFVRPGLWPWGPAGAAALAFLITLILAVWIVQRGRRGLGAPHPGLWWYAAACLCLALALAAAFGMAWWSDGYVWLRLAHLHLNTLGFVGLTALGTLQVLMPTAVGRPDPLAGPRLKRDLAPALLGVLLTAAGAALGAAGLPASAAGLVSFLGLALWLWPLLRLAAAWWRHFRPELLSAHGAPASLGWALLGLIVLSLLGPGHGLGSPSPLDGGRAILGFVLACLLPLVTGAVSQLLPVWLRPGRQDAWHGEQRRRLGRYAGLRAGLFFTAGFLVVLGWRPAALLVIPALSQFIGVLLATRAKPAP